MGDTIAYRKKYWSEMEDKARIEELMRELVRTQIQVMSLSIIIQGLMDHSHLDGQIVKPFSPFNNNSGEDSRGSFYFRVEEFKDGPK